MPEPMDEALTRALKEALERIDQGLAQIQAALEPKTKPQLELVKDDDDG